MAVEQQRQELQPVIWPSPPATDRGNPAGFVHDANGALVLTEAGAAQAAIAQRIVLRHAILLESHDDLAARYGYSTRQVKSIAIGRAWSHLTRPVRRRLTALGLGNLRARRTPAGRAQFKSVAQQLCAQAVDMIRWPEHYSDDQRYTLATDLYLISGAWREDEQP